MKRFAFLPALALVFTAACQDSPTAATSPPTPKQSAAETHTVSQSFPVSEHLWVSCANGGSGETIYLTGTQHYLSHYTIKADTLSVIGVFNTQGTVTGTGMTTGETYHSTGVQLFAATRFVTEYPPYVVTAVSSFRMIGTVPGNNFLVLETFHHTINADGTQTSYVDNHIVKCT